MNDQGLIAMMMLKRIDKEFERIKTLEECKALTQQELNNSINILKETDMNIKYSYFETENERNEFYININDVNKNAKLKNITDIMNHNTMIEIIECGHEPEEE